MTQLVLILVFAALLLLAGMLYVVWWALPYLITAVGVGIVSLAASGLFPPWIGVAGAIAAIGGPMIIRSRKYKAHVAARKQKSDIQSLEGEKPEEGK